MTRFYDDYHETESPGFVDDLRSRTRECHRCGKSFSGREHEKKIIKQSEKFRIFCSACTDREIGSEFFLWMPKNRR